MRAVESWMEAAEAARALRVTRPTLYAYVSRGYIRSESKPGSPRQRRYSRDDVDRLRRRTEERDRGSRHGAPRRQVGSKALELARRR